MISFPRLRLQSTLIAALFSGTVAAADVLALQSVAPGIYVHYGKQEEITASNSGDIANIGFIVGNRCVAVIDSGTTAQEGRQLLAALRRVTPLPICYVINTHAHIDHLYGNQAFVAEGPQFVAHINFAHAMAERDRVYQKTLMRDVGEAALGSPLVTPTLEISVGKAQTLDLGDRLLKLEAWPTAHTDSDLTIWDETTRTWWLSDLLFVDHIPVLDGSVKGWLAACDAILTQTPRQVIPGHGKMAGNPDNWRAAVTRQRDYLLDIQGRVRQAVKAGRSLTEAVDTIHAMDTHWLLLDVYHKRNVTAAYAELEWEE